MAEATQFGHDRLGHLLADHLLEVPRFQRSYAWDQTNVEEFLSDLEAARGKDVDYFMGTVVFARPDAETDRRRIVDGQQRLATTAVLLIAIRDELQRLGRSRQADELGKRFLRGYVIRKNEEVERLLLSPKDLPDYQALLDGSSASIEPNSRIRIAYESCVSHLAALTAQSGTPDTLIDIANQLESRVQVLVAEASDLPEAYVIFETLNDRGADLTTADLLKNYLFSSSKDYFQFVESRWMALEMNFERPEDLVKFIRYHHVSQHGAVATRKLYRSIQGDVAGSAAKAKKYVEDLSKSQDVYLALRDPDNSYWSNSPSEVRNAVHAFRRFQLEANIPLLLAAFATWTKRDASKLLVKVAAWSIRAQFNGRLGGGVADELFGSTARAIFSKEAKNQTSVRALLARLIPSDVEFTDAFINYGDISTSRAKYLLAMLEIAAANRAQRDVTPIEWFSMKVTVEHVLSLSEGKGSEATAAVVNRIGNLTLLEKRLNRSAGSRPFTEKKPAYVDSAFDLTKALGKKRTWSPRTINGRTRELAELACLAWPGT